VLDIDIKSFFDTIDWSLLLKAVHQHTDCPWVLLYIERWLKAPVQLEDGSVVQRTAGTPQGGVISPLLANLFLHYAFDAWMARNHPAIAFERYADDIICHCRSEAEAQALWRELETRVTACGLTLHPQKTKLVYCKDWNRRGDYPRISFDFLGYNFRPRKKPLVAMSAHGFVRAGGQPKQQVDLRARVAASIPLASMLVFVVELVLAEQARGVDELRHDAQSPGRVGGLTGSDAAQRCALSAVTSVLLPTLRASMTPALISA
jgi:group II intron reverse transcriptase/maturase